MTISKVELLDVDGTWLRDLSGWIEGSRLWADPRRGFGSGAIALPSDHDDAGHLRERRMVRYTLDGAAGGTFTWLLHRPARHRISKAGQVDKVDHWTGPGALAYLGTDDLPHAIVVGVGDTGRRPFGWIADDYDDTGWTSPAPHSGGHYAAPRNADWVGVPDRWPDDLAEWLFTEDVDDPTAPGWFRQDLDAHGPQQATLLLSGQAEVWFHGEQVATSGSRHQFTRATIGLTGLDVLAVHAVGATMWTIGVEGPDGAFQVLYRSTTGAPFDTSQAEIQHVIVDAEASPYPWGASYPSTGPDNLQGKIYFTYNGVGPSAGVAVNEGDGTFDAAAVEADLEGLASISGVSVSGTGTSADPLVVQWDQVGPRQLLTLHHHDLRHDHDTTTVKQVQAGKVQSQATSGADKIRFTGSTPTGVTYGYVMGRLLDAAIDRGCIPAASWTFTDLLDSAGQPWSVSLPLYVARDGDQLGDLTVALTQNFAADCRMHPDLEVGLYDHLGSDLSATVQLVDEADVDTPADNAVSDARVDGQAQLATVARIETGGGFGWAVDTAREAAHGRLETKVAYGQAATVEEVAQAALSTLDDVAAMDRQTVESHGPAGARPYANYGPGDLVGARQTAGGPMVAWRVEDIGVNDLPAGEVDFDVKLERR